MNTYIHTCEYLNTKHARIKYIKYINTYMRMHMHAKITGICFIPVETDLFDINACMHACMYTHMCTYKHLRIWFRQRILCTSATFSHTHPSFYVYLIHIFTFFILSINLYFFLCRLGFQSHLKRLCKNISSSFMLQRRSSCNIVPVATSFKLQHPSSCNILQVATSFKSCNIIEVATYLKTKWQAASENFYK